MTKPCARMPTRQRAWKSQGFPQVGLVISPRASRIRRAVRPRSSDLCVRKNDEPEVAVSCPAAGKHLIVAERRPLIALSMQPKAGVTQSALCLAEIESRPWREQVADDASVFWRKRAEPPCCAARLMIISIRSCVPRKLRFVTRTVQKENP